MTTFDLGAYRRQITTASDTARKAFDDGLIWIFGFNHEMAAQCFATAIAADPDCAMAHWGLAYAIGPNYNRPWEFMQRDEQAAMLRQGWAAIHAAQAVSSRITAVEAALVDALAARFPESPEIESFAPYNDAFAAAMREVYKAFPCDLDVVCIFAEALINRTPWQLWDQKTDAPREGSDALEALEVLDGLFETVPEAWDHPGLLHIYIHVVEMSPFPEKALRHGERLVDLVPESGHLVHMATHIDLVCGEYQNVVTRNRRAAIIDRKYAALAGAENFYTVYRVHNVHFEAYGAMLLGQPDRALAAVDELMDMLPDPIVRFLPDMFESFWGKKAHVLVRFGRWQAILDMALPDDPQVYTYSTAAIRQARAIALANLGRIAEAEVEQELAREACLLVQPSRMVFSNTATLVLGIGAAMMDGEVAYKSGRIEEGLAHLRRAVELEDGLLYDEPWGWMQPTRHALGALLMEAGQFAEAEAVYRADLGFDPSVPRSFRHPRNVWSLHGLHECLNRRGDTVEIRFIKPMLDQARARATVPIRASCYCRRTCAAC